MKFFKNINIGKKTISILYNYSFYNRQNKIFKFFYPLTYMKVQEFI